MDITDDPDKTLMYEMYDRYMGGATPPPEPDAHRANRAHNSGKALAMATAARIRGNSEFARDTEPFRRELIAHCYRMLGSLHDAEDVVQETYLRAGGRMTSSKTGRRCGPGCTASRRTPASPRCNTAAGVCCRPGSVAPATTRTPSQRPRDRQWLGCNRFRMPLLILLPTTRAVVASRESLRLALVASLQHLPAQQRAVLLLRDVLAFPAAEVAAMLGTTVAAVKSALQRARATMKDAAPAPDEITEPREPRARELLAQYIAAFENADAATLERVLRHDAALEMVGSRTWFVAARPVCHTSQRMSLDRPAIGGCWRSSLSASPRRPPTAATQTAHCGPSGSRC